MSRHDCPGTNLRLSQVQDEDLKSYIRRCDDIGMPCLMLQLIGAAQYIIDRAHPNGRAPPLSKDWLSRWLERNPDCRRMKQKSQNINWTAMATFEVYSHYFTELKKVIYTHGITTYDTYNMDETGFRIGVGGSQWIVTMEMNRPQVSASETSRDYITSIEAISGDGQVLNPMLVVQGVNHLHQ
ncbi:uncharacterized protein CC84DRAFT_520111 [Paraphaeosphaeria sporulosa]|uniref:HTH CENPB-type domain-containing protein n=1 Tax=Paraphaeosphaeria sporulosa TaxID=1460663 RepID=A0A177BSZ9_9PLEO|nr:uncharacterized protein CC84DRAFT_520111 [Paraphaeosphaeria sporulosa]OAF98503.1 hypothetical protein CC84DRAFT_520111 [Paraphaeosphaeria sporulosa]